MWAMIRQAAVCVLAGAVVACTHLIPPPTPPASAPAAPDEAWARVLQRAVDRQGRLDFTLVARDRTDLDAYLAYVAQVSPHTHAALFPSRPDALAYYLNSYNALALYGVMLKQPSDFDGFPARVQFFKLTTYRVGGQSVSLYDYENTIIRPLGEPRVHFALNCMVVGCLCRRSRFAPRPWSSSSRLRLGSFVIACNTSRSSPSGVQCACRRFFVFIRRILSTRGWPLPSLHTSTAIAPRKSPRILRSSLSHTTGL